MLVHELVVIDGCGTTSACRQSEFRSINQHHPDPSPGVNQPAGGFSPGLVLRIPTAQGASVQFRPVIDEPAATMSRRGLPGGQDLLNGLGLRVVADNDVFVS